MRMARSGLPVPPAFGLPTAWCGRTDAAAKLSEALAQGVRVLEGATHSTFGGARLPLLVSVRSGAAVSMPGMMETVIDVGLNAETVEALVRETGNPRLAWDSYRRLVQGYAEVVAGLPTAPFDALVAAAVATAEAESERDLDHRDLRTLTRAMLASYRGLAGEPFPSEPGVQLLTATQAGNRPPHRAFQGVPLPDYAARILDPDGFNTQDYQVRLRLGTIPINRGSTSCPPAEPVAGPSTSAMTALIVGRTILAVA